LSKDQLQHIRLNQVLALDTMKGFDTEVKKIQDKIDLSNRKCEDEEVQQRLQKKLTKMFSSRKLQSPYATSFEPTKVEQVSAKFTKEVGVDLSSNVIRDFDKL
jgi:hypothetical protein